MTEDDVRRFFLHLVAAARADFLVPVRALSVQFRARFLARLRAQLPDVILPARVWRQPWVVYCQPAVQGSGAVLRYLARYVRRVAITSARLVSVTREDVTFGYRDRRDAGAGAWRTMTLAPDEFLRRFLQHVLPRGFHKVRYYGIWHPSAAPLRAPYHGPCVAHASAPSKPSALRRRAAIHSPVPVLAARTGPSAAPA